MATCEDCRFYHGNEERGSCLSPLPISVEETPITDADQDASECEMFKQGLEEADGNV